MDYTTFARPENQKTRTTGAAVSESDDAEDFLEEPDDDEFHEEPDDDSDVEEIDPFAVNTDALSLQDTPSRLSRLDAGSSRIGTENKRAPALPNLAPDPHVATLRPPSQPAVRPSKVTPKKLSQNVDPPQLPVGRSKKPHPLIPSDPITGYVPTAPIQSIISCKLCSTTHEAGKCPLREIEVQKCPACGYNHFHQKRTCPLLQDLEYVETMYNRLKESTEDKEVVDAAKTFIRGVRADLQLRKKGGRDRKVPSKDKTNDVTT